MVVVLHLLGQGGILYNAEEMSANYCVGWLLEIAAYCAVNCYALISGYVMVDTKIRIYKLIELWISVLFYSFLITVAVAIISPQSVGGKEILKALTPIMSEQYWYFTAYFGMFLFIPFLNRIINGLSVKEAKFLSASLLIVFSVIPTIRNKDIFATKYGYSTLWLICMYLLGGIIKKFVRNRNRRLLCTTYGVCILGTWGIKLILTSVFEHSVREDHNIDRFINYTFILFVIVAVCLLILFAEWKIKNKRLIQIIQFVSPLSFGVYLIHAQPLIYNNYLKNAIEFLLEKNAIIMALVVLGGAVAVFGGCACIEWVRQRIFAFFRIQQGCIKLGNMIGI